MNTKIRFELKRDNNSEKKLIYLMFSYGFYEIDLHGNKKYITFKYSTGLKIEPEFWDNNLMKANVTYIKKFGKDLNSELNKIEGCIEDIFRKLEIDGICPPPDQLRTELNIKRGKQKRAVIAANIVEFIDAYISTEESKTVNAKDIKTIGKYRNISNKLKEYQIKIKQRLTFQNLTPELYNGFFEFTNQEWIKIKGYGLAQNTLWEQQKWINKFLLEGENSGFKIQFNYKDKKYRIEEDDVDHIFLTIDEIYKIINLDLSNHPPSYNKSRDYFIIMAFTGLRVEDLNTIVGKMVEEKIDRNENKFSITAKSTQYFNLHDFTIF